MKSGLRAQCLQPPAAPQLAALDLLESRISGLITQVEAQLTMKPVQPVPTSQPEVNGSPSRDASSRGPCQQEASQQETAQVRSSSRTEAASVCCPSSKPTMCKLSGAQDVRQEFVASNAVPCRDTLPA